jgi:hypothetical protein
MVALLVLWLAALAAISALGILPLAGQEARGAIRQAVPG